MKNTFLKLILPAFTTIGLSSCLFLQSVKCEDPVSLGLYFTGYDSSELSTVVIRQFAKNSDLTSPQQTFYCTSGQPSPGTLSIGNLSTNTEFRLQEYALFFKKDYDYTIEIVKAGRIHKLTAITFGHNSTPDVNHGCVNATSWYMDGKYVHNDSYIKYIGPTGGTPTVVK